MSAEEPQPMPGGGWISGPCNGGPDQDDEQVGSASIPAGGLEDADELGQQAEFPQVNPWAGGIEQGATHFALRVRPNQRKYRGRPGGAAQDD